MQRIRIRKEVNIDSMLFPSPVITYDILNRVSQLQFTYQSIVVTYNATWVGDTNSLSTYTQTVADRTV